MADLKLSPEGEETLAAICSRTGTSSEEALVAAIALLALVTEHLEDPCAYVSLRAPERDEVTVNFSSLYAAEQAAARASERDRQAHRYFAGLLRDIDHVRLALLVHGNPLSKVATALNGLDESLWNKVGGCIQEELWLTFDALREQAQEAPAEAVTAARKQLAAQIVANR